LDETRSKLDGLGPGPEQEKGLEKLKAQRQVVNAQRQWSKEKVKLAHIAKSNATLARQGLKVAESKLEAVEDAEDEINCDDELEDALAFEGDDTDSDNNENDVTCQEGEDTCQEGEDTCQEGEDTCQDADDGVANDTQGSNDQPDAAKATKLVLQPWNATRRRLLIAANATLRAAAEHITLLEMHPSIEKDSALFEANVRLFQAHSQEADAEHAVAVADLARIQSDYEECTRKAKEHQEAAALLDEAPRKQSALQRSERWKSRASNLRSWANAKSEIIEIGKRRAELLAERFRVLEDKEGEQVRDYIESKLPQLEVAWSDATAVAAKAEILLKHGETEISSQIAGGSDGARRSLVAVSEATVVIARQTADGIEGILEVEREH